MTDPQFEKCLKVSISFYFSLVFLTIVIILDFYSVSTDLDSVFITGSVPSRVQTSPYKSGFWNEAFEPPNGWDQMTLSK